MRHGIWIRSCITMLGTVTTALTAPCAARFAHAIPVAPGFVVENAFPGQSFDSPVQLIFMGDGRKLVVEQDGVVWMMEASGDRVPTPFIDLHDKVLGYGGMGMLGVALDPDFAQNRWVYFAYTVDPDSDGVTFENDTYSRIERYQVSQSNPNQIDLATRHVLIGTNWSSGIPCPDTFHSIGMLRFAADKSLLAASGDASHFAYMDPGGHDPDQFLPGRASPSEDIGSFRALSLNSLNGKILRLDKETGYGLDSNPFWDGNPVSARSRVWVYGLRNPFRFTIAPGTGSSDPTEGNPGTLLIGNTGWYTYESVFVARTGGLNLGWPCREGPLPQAEYQAVSSTAYPNPNVICSAPPSAENPASPTPPTMWWHHQDGSLSYPPGWTGVAATGGEFHHGTSYPAPYAGSYFVSDFSGAVHWVHLDNQDQPEAWGDFMPDAEGPVNIEWDPQSGDLFYCAQFANEVRHIRYVLSSEPISVVVRADSANGTTHYSVPGVQSPWVDLRGQHDLTLDNFSVRQSGWRGAGTLADPYRLTFDGVDDRVTLPANSLPEVQDQATVVLWIKTGPDVTQSQTVFEWLSQYMPNYPGMGISIGNGSLRVNHGDWVPVATVHPNTWYQVALVKVGDGEIRAAVNGETAYGGTGSGYGPQSSELVLGASTRGGVGVYSDFFKGSIAEMTIWPADLSPSEILALFQYSQATYQPVGPEVVELRADAASGTGPYNSPGAKSPWFDLIGGPNATLRNFTGTAASGWQGDGTPYSPRRLVLDGIDDHVTIPEGSVSQIANPVETSVGMWIQTGQDVTNEQYLLQWVSDYAAPYPGMALAIENGEFRVLGDSWVSVAAVEPETWYFLAVAKGPGKLRAYVNGVQRYADNQPGIGGQTSEIVLGASTYRGSGNYGEYFHGSIAQLGIWRKALIDPEVGEAYHNDLPLYVPNVGVHAPPVQVPLRIMPSAVVRAATLEFSLPAAGFVDLTLYAVDGRRIRNLALGWRPAGPQRLEWNGLDAEGRRVRTGVYYVHLRAPGANATCRLINLR